MLEGNTKGAILVVTYERWHTTTYIGVSCNGIPPMTDPTILFITAPAWKRLIAQLIDITLVFLTVLVLTVAFHIPGPMFKWAILWTYLTYSILMDAYKHGTVGKLYLGLKVVKTSEMRSNFLTAFYRNLSKIFFALLLWDAILILLMTGHIGLHNTIAKSKVVQSP